MAGGRCDGSKRKDPAVKRYCDVCGCESDEYWMKSFNIGAKTLWLCWGCFQNAEREADESDMTRDYRLHKISESKKRKR